MCPALPGNKVTMFTMAAQHLFNVLQGQSDLYYDVSMVLRARADIGKNINSCIMLAEKNNE